MVANTVALVLAHLLVVCPWLVHGQDPPLPNSFPNAYPGQPTGDFSPAWQDYFLVDNSQLPNVSFPLPRSFAGNIPVDRADRPNNTLFFWGFEKSDGSLTAESSSEPWLLWLQGGPGSSSMLGLILENGPLLLQPDSSMRPNNYSWDRLADAIWVDQPVGTGYSTADSRGYVADDDQMAEDFLGFLSNLVKVFPSLATRPLYITGESYAGHWIPYITKALFSTPDAPVRVAKIAIGNGAFASYATFLHVPVVTLIETYPHLVSYDTEVLAYFREQHHLCGFDLNFTYPQTGGKFPTISTRLPANPQSPFFALDTPPTLISKLTRRSEELVRYARSVESLAYHVKRSTEPKDKREVQREKRQRSWKRDLSLRANGTIDPWYGCNLLDELVEYAVNFTFPWNVDPGALNIYDAPDVLFPKEGNNVVDAIDPTFFNDPRTRGALHAPTSKDWQDSIPYPFINTLSTGDPSPVPQTFFDELAANASRAGVGIILYSGNDDMLVAHRSTELAIQNTTFGGTQGFSVKPGTPWYDDDGNFAGIVHQERGWTYALFQDAGHLVPTSKPAAAYAFLRDFILSNSTRGLVLDDTPPTPSVEGGRDPALTSDYLPPRTAAVYFGNRETEGVVMYPAETVSAWDAAVASFYAATAIRAGGSRRPDAPGETQGTASSEVRVAVRWNIVFVCASILVSSWI